MKKGRRRCHGLGRHCIPVYCRSHRFRSSCRCTGTGGQRTSDAARDLPLPDHSSLSLATVVTSVAGFVAGGTPGPVVPSLLIHATKILLAKIGPRRSYDLGWRAISVSCRSPRLPSSCRCTGGSTYRRCRRGSGTARAPFIESIHVRCFCRRLRCRGRTWSRRPRSARRSTGTGGITYRGRRW